MKHANDIKVREFLKKKYPNSNPAPHYIRVEVVASNDKSQYEFNIKTTNADGRVESKLNATDVFMCSGIGIFLLKEAKASTGLGVLQSYPNQTVFAAAADFIPEHLEAIYNGYLNYVTGDKVDVDKLPTLVFRTVPQTQQSAATNKSMGNIEDLLYSGAESFIFDGGKTQSLTLTIPTFGGIKIASVDPLYDHKIVFYAQGYIVKGRASK